LNPKLGLIEECDDECRGLNEGGWLEELMTRHYFVGWSHQQMKAQGGSKSRYYDDNEEGVVSVGLG
jgi:hypothetical protein